MRQKIKPITSIVTRAARLPLAIAISLVLIGGVWLSVAHADQYDQQIQALQSQNSSTQSIVDSLQAQATSYQDAIDQLQAQINGLQSAISINQAKQASLQQQIIQDQADIAQQKQVLGDDIKAMYVDGQMTTIEELATSKSLSAFVDAQTYRNAVQSKIQDTLQQITTLEAQLNDQKTQVNQLIGVLTQQQNQLTASESQQSQLLSYTQAQQASYTQQIQSNQQQITSLRAQQIAANRQLLSGGGKVDASGSCGGGYPATASGPGGNWGCDYSLDNTIDNWGMYNRECVSYTAWMVYKTYGYMPYWGGSGNANEWPSDAQAAGIPIGYTPKVGSVAIYMGGSTDPFGHAMWVTAVNGDGTITVQQYNLYYDGNYYQTTINSAGLTYIYFGQ